VLRNLFDIGILWNEALSRILLLWSALAGAMVATRYNKHIQISLLDRLIPNVWRNLFYCFIDFICALVCFIVAYFSTDFVIQEYLFGEYAFSVVKFWIAASIIPITFTVIGVRFFVQMLAASIKEYF